MRVTAATVGAHFAGAYLMPGLRHRQDHAIAVEQLKGKGSVRRNFSEEAGVRITFGVEDRIAIGGQVAHRQLTKNAQPFVDVVIEMLPFVRSVTAMGVGFHRQQPDRPDVTVAVFAGVGTLGKPVAIGIVLAGVKGIQAAIGIILIDARMTGEALALILTARAHEAIGRTGGQQRVDRAIVGQPGQFDRLRHPMNRLVGDHRTRPDLVVVGIIFD